jgi:hypothetical protein
LEIEAGKEDDVVAQKMSDQERPELEKMPPVGVGRSEKLSIFGIWAHLFFKARFGAMTLQ